MKLLKQCLLLLSLFTATLFIQSCKKDACKERVCLFNSACEDGTCICEDGLVGLDCGSYDYTRIQDVLNIEAGPTPMQLFQSGIELSNLYGKEYKGGLIFYLDVLDEIPGVEGMLASLSDESNTMEWGCHNMDVPELNNVLSNPTIPEEEEGARVGDGKINSLTILDNDCVSSAGGNIAVIACRDNGTGWFLPSRGELNLVYRNLKLRGHSDFAGEMYWSSTEEGKISAWFQNFDSGAQWIDGKIDAGVSVRAVKTF